MKTVSVEERVRGLWRNFLSQGAIFLNRAPYCMFTDHHIWSVTHWHYFTPVFCAKFSKLQRCWLYLEWPKLYIFLMHFLRTRLPETTVYVLGAFANLRKETIRFVTPVCLSVRPHGTTRLPLYGFPWNFVFEYFSKICRGNSSLIKIWQKTGI
jgi:hypothetical protein